MTDIMRRPSPCDEYVRRRAAELILPQVKAWAGPDFRPQEERHWLESLADSVSSGDGYEIAESLKRHHHWGVDAQLVDILDGGWVGDAIEELTAQWVRCLNIQPQFSVDDWVICPVRRDEPGKITSVNARLAQYGVHYPDMRDGSCYIVNFEDARAE